MQNFMAEDVVGGLGAIVLFPLFLWIPGYVIGWCLNLFQFRQRTTVFRIVSALPISIAICPSVTYLLGRFVGMPAVWVFYIGAATVFAGLVLSAWRRGARRISVPKGAAAFVAILAVWLGIVLFSTIDIQIGDRLYYPTSTFDFSLRAALTHAITVSGIPPTSPFIFPGHPVGLRYHYFWLLMCSLVNQTAPRVVSARHAEMGGVFWAGVGLLAMVALCLRLFTVNPAAPLRRRVLVGTLLAGITGLDILPSLMLLSFYARGWMAFVLPSGESWNEYVDWFLHSSLWAPHAVGALVAELTAFLIIWHAPADRRRWVVSSLAAALGLASTVGISIWVAFVFAAFLIAWSLVCVRKRWWGQFRTLALCGAASLVLLWPYLRDLSGPAVSGVSSPGPPGIGSLVHWTVREFSLAALIRSPGMPHWERLVLVNGSLLPMNYLLEFGFFFLVARFKWSECRRSGKPLSPVDLACWVMLSASALICTFLKSVVIGNNDLGWRGFLLAQFILLLWAVDLWVKRDTPGWLSAGQKGLLVTLIGLGIAGSAYDLAITRFYPLLADSGVLPPLDWMAPDREFGKRTYAARAAYEWIRRQTPETATVQYNPAVARQETAALAYADRGAAAADLGCNVTFGGNPQLCAPIVSHLQKVYAAAGRTPSESLIDACRGLPVNILVFKDTDPVWADPNAWVWRAPPLFANSYFRVFGCGHFDPATPDKYLQSAER